jgi:putative hydrolase of the HAD superfamily
MRFDGEAIIFDFGGVIINIDYDATIRAFKALGIADFEALYSQASQSRLFDDLETGKISSQRFINGLLEILPKGISANQVVNAWNAMILEIPAERIALLQELRKKYRIFLLSNTNGIHIQKALHHWSKTTDLAIHDLFHHVYLSHEMGMRKPHAEIFETVCSEQKLNPKQTLFIDDSSQHIQGAKAFGLNTHHLKPDEKIQSLFS